MKTAEEICNEKDPFLREIWDAGYDTVIQDLPLNKIVLINTSNNNRKEICMFEWQQTIIGLTFKTGLLYSSEIHKWITEADGSADRFRNLIKP